MKKKIIDIRMFQTSTAQETVRLTARVRKKTSLVRQLPMILWQLIPMWWV
jgi:hypothetical protein